jgi:hypothetical protein
MDKTKFISAQRNTTVYSNETGLVCLLGENKGGHGKALLLEQNVRYNK